MVDRSWRADEAGVGPLVLPVPSDGARWETLDDGTTRVVDRLRPEQVGPFMRVVAERIRDGELEPPAWIELGLADGGSVRVERGQGPEAASAIIGALERMADAVTAADAPRWFAFTLDCGCGVRVERRDGARG